MIAGLAVVAVACSGGEGSSTDVALGGAVSGTIGPQHRDGSNAHGPPLVDVRPEPPGPRCPTGGTAIRTGKDNDFDGKLDDGEVKQVQYVCNGANGKTPVLKTKAEPIGTRCPTGGQAISWGYDDNMNGVLDVAERKDTTYVCNGANGQNGANGANGASGKSSLVTLIDITPGDPRCLSGGKGIYSGLDANGDGLLQPTEVQGSSFVCNGANGASGTTSLVDVVAEAAGADCTHGGHRVSSGSDTNGNGALDVAEIVKVAHVCHGAAGANGLSSLVRVSLEPAGATCPAGGRRIETGLDVNASGALDGGEVTSVGYACNGTNGGAGKSALVRQTAEPAGASCPSTGGTRLDTGVDTSGDGVLQNGEITHTSYLCNGQPGPTGPAGASAIATLVTATPEPAGATCGSGGQRVDLGPDANTNGLLDSSEIAQTRYVCNGVGGAGAGVAVLTQTTPLPTSACNKRGGVGVKAGPDASGDGVLQSSEVVTTVSMCNLVRATSAIACAHGFDPVDTGLDRNLNGAFDEIEVTGHRCDLHPAVRSIGAGDRHTCTSWTDNRVFCWGEGEADQTGPEAGSSARPSPMLVYDSNMVPLRAASVVAAGMHSCALLTDATVRCWGSNGSGRLGGGDNPQHAFPVQVTGLGAVASLAAGEEHTCAALTDGTARCWGDDSHGQLGANVVPSGGPTPLVVSGLSGVVSLTAGKYHTCAALTDGSARCWGANHFGEVGDGTTESRATPTTVAGLTDVTAIAAGHFHACAVSAGTVRCWGNVFGPTPVTVPGIADARTIAAGPRHTCVGLVDGTARCWGENAFGQLGDGAFVSRPTPAPVTGLAGVETIAVGEHHTCAAGYLTPPHCWGRNHFGELGIGSFAPTATPTPAPVAPLP
jgi:alpha-tubulin suppressor-like RCC1 family protein